MFPQIKKVFDLVGGSSFFKELVNRFYDKIELDPILKIIFPEHAFEIDKGRKYQFLFMVQIFGGPSDYEKLRGHPLLRKRHIKFPIGLKERDRWLKLMFETLDELGIDMTHPAHSIMQSYFEHMANKMVNQTIEASELSKTELEIKANNGISDN